MKVLLWLSFLLLAGVILLYPGNWPSPEILAKIGEVKIKDVDISYRMGTEKAYGNDAVTREAAVVSLVNDAIEHEVSRANGVSVTSEEIAAFRKHIDNTTKAPETLEKIKLVFGNNKAAYERLYIEPKIINVKIRFWYSRNAGIHQDEKNLIEKAYYEIWSGKSMEEAARESGLNFSTMEIAKNNGTSQLEQLLPGGERNDTMAGILETLSEGEIYENIVEDDYGYKVLRLVHENNSIYSVEAITSGKRPFTEWFSENATSINIEIFDPEMKNNIVSKYQSVWWVGRFKK